MNFDDMSDPLMTINSDCNNNQNKKNCFDGICNMFTSCNLKSTLPYIFLAIILFIYFSKNK